MKKGRDRDGYQYKHPSHSCTKCLNYPCLEEMDNLLGDFGAYGCKHFKDVDTFDICKK